MSRKLKFFSDERGQLFAGHVVAVFIIGALVFAATTHFLRQKSQQEAMRYRSWAINVAQYGFENAVSYFKNDPLGRYLPDTITPLNQSWTAGTVADPWKAFPDLAFAPSKLDTDYWDLSIAAGTLMHTLPISPAGLAAVNSLDNTPSARAMIRTIPLNHNVMSITAAASTTTLAATLATTLNGVEVARSNYWGRFVVKRQLLRNWSPGPNTYSAFTDKDAVHDVSHLRSNVRPGSGTTWSIVSTGYIFQWPTDLTHTAAHEGGSLLNSPYKKYQGKPLLLAKAKVYGEITRVNVNVPAAALWVNDARGTTISCNGALIARGTAYAYARGVAANVLSRTAGCASPNTNGTVIGFSNGAPLNFARPSASSAFPGQDMDSLKAVALAMSTSTTPKVGANSSIFPHPTSPSARAFEDAISTNAFYYVEGNATLGNTINDRRMTGIGVVVVDGHLTIPAGNPSEFSGIVFVNGNVDLGPGVSISGILIATGLVRIGNPASSSLKTQIEFSQDAIDNARENVLRSFQVLSSNVVAVQ